MNKKIVMCAAAACLLIPTVGCASNPAAVINLHTAKTASLENWTEGSAAAKSITDYVASVCTEGSEHYVAPADRIAVFDVDGTLCGERFPTYFDNCLMFQRILHDNSCKVSAEDKAYTEAYEKSMLYGLPKPETDKSSGQILAEAFKGFTVEEYQAYVRDFMETPAWGFEGMKYGESFFKPMVSVVEYLAANDFHIYLCSGQERNMLRELTKDALGKWVKPSDIIGTTFELTAEQQGDVKAKNYDYAPDDRVLLAGNMTMKNQKMNKVNSIINEIGAKPIIAFGNSTGDISMGQYVMQNGGKAYMLLCDDTDRDYGDPETASKFAEECKKRGFETVSMKNDFKTIYGDNVVCTKNAKDAAA
ncbi:MAG TPA: haloacid dehalogenase-like hydrolase [Ruminococcus sp.]|nr:haloacid dehalogenase-like hydrolase [Ruminococcus sp.]